MLLQKIVKCAKDKSGIASLEYAVLAVGILTGLYVAVQTVAGILDPIFSATIPGVL